MPSNPPPYQARHSKKLGWHFITASGVTISGFADRVAALKASVPQERADREEAEQGSSPVSVVMSEYFFPRAKHQTP